MAEAIGKFPFTRVKTTGEIDSIEYVDSAQEAYDRQVNLYHASCQYSSGGGSRFQIMLDKCYDLVQEAKQRLDIQPTHQPARMINQDDGTGGIMTGLNIGLAATYSKK